MCSNTQLILWRLRILHSSFLIYYVVKQLIHVIFKNKIKQEKKTFSKSTNYIQYSKNDPIPLCKALTMPDQSFCGGYLLPLELFFPKYNHYSRHIIENSINYRQMNTYEFLTFAKQFIAKIYTNIKTILSLSKFAEMSFD